MGRPNVLSTGSSTFTLYGAEFGVLSFTLHARLGTSRGEATRWQSQTTVLCRMSHGVRSSRRVTITTCHRSGSGSVSHAASFDIPRLRPFADLGLRSVVPGIPLPGMPAPSAPSTEVRRMNNPGSGSSSFTVRGASFGHSAFTGRLRLARTTCEATGWQSDSALRCLSSNSVRGTVLIAMTIGERSGSASKGFSIDIQSVSSQIRRNKAGTGSTSVTILGAGFGLIVRTASGSVGNSKCETTAWRSETSVRCLIGCGTRGTRRVVITAGERSGSRSAVYSVDLGSISKLRQLNRAGTGSGSVTVQGAGLGMVATTVMVRIGQSRCESTGWASETSVGCKVSHGARGTRRVVTSAGERVGSLSSVFSIDLSSLSASKRTNRAGTGSASVTM